MGLDVIILCGGEGKRLRPLTEEIPKPMVLINGKPIVHYIIKHLEKYNINNYIFATGYKSQIIEKYLNNNYSKLNFLTVFSGNVDIIKRIQDSLNYVKNDFLILYGDTISNVDINKLTDFNFNNKQHVTITLYKYKSEFGLVEIDKNYKVISFSEKPILEKYINIGYFFFRKSFADIIHNYSSWEEFIESIVVQNSLSGYIHNDLHITVNTVDELRNAENKIQKLNL